jgi:hypothetical protein
MTIKLAHQSTRTPSADDDAATKQFVLDNKGAGDILFRWNRTDISELQLVDPLAQGWALRFVAKSGGVPEHLELKAPPSWSNATGPVRVLVSADLAMPDHDMVITHEFFDPTLYTQTIGAVDRYVGQADHALAVWDIAHGGSPDTYMQSVLVESVAPSML